MRLRVISQRTEIPNLNPNEKIVHIAFRASNVDFLNLMQRCPRIRRTQIPHSYQKTMSNAIRVFLEMQGVELLEETYGVTERTLMSITPSKMIEEIRTLTASGTSADDVANQIQKKAKIGSDLIKYIAKTKVSA